MNNQNPLLRIQFDGDAVSASRIPVSHLLRFLSNLNKALQRTGRVLKGEGASVRQGQPEKDIKTEVALDLTLLTQGSPSAVLGLERSKEAQLPGVEDYGFEIIEKAVNGLRLVQGNQDALPDGYDAGVLMAWRDAGTLFKMGVNNIEVTLNRPNKPLVTKYTHRGFSRIQERIQGPKLNIRTIEGRLLMADFKEHGTRCRVHPSAGEPVLCLFGDEQREEVLENMLQFVSIVGEAREDPVSGKIVSIEIHDIERLEERETENVELLPKGTPILGDFWESQSIEDLARAQQVEPMANVTSIFGTWPGEEGDGFEIEIDSLRHMDISDGNAR